MPLPARFPRVFTSILPKKTHHVSQRVPLKFAFFRLVLSCGTFRLIYDGQAESLFLALESSKKNASLEIGPAELFGFGSGDYAEGPEANDIMSDLGGRWVAFKLSSEEECFVAEADKRLADHVRSCDIFGKVAWLHFGLP